MSPNTLCFWITCALNLLSLDITTVTAQQQKRIPTFSKMVWWGIILWDLLGGPNGSGQVQI